MVLKRGSAAVAALMALLAGAIAAKADDPATLKIGHLFPAGHYLWAEGGQPFAEAVTRATDGRVKFEVYPAGQLGKDVYALLKSGIVDIAIIPPSYFPEKFPLTAVNELPGLYGSACEATAKFWAIAEDGKPLDTAELKPLGLHTLFLTTLPPYAVMTATKKVTTLADLAGLKIRANGAAMEDTIRALGAVPVRVESPDLYNSLTRGTVDGGFFPYSGLAPYKLEKVFHYSVQGAQLGSGGTMYAMTTAAWNKLSPGLKATMTTAAASAQDHLCSWQDKESSRVRDKIVAEEGHTVTVLSAEQQALWQARVEGVANKWAKDIDATGKPGSAILAAYRAAQGPK
jgi:TRAP-type C4-dicarboxylate transport system substrate-binding protein